MAGELRITGGRLARRRFAVPPAADRGALRPTSDKVRAAVMNVLGPRLDGARVLDAYAGSGALGLEALSRGAAHALFIEHDRRSGAVILQNLEDLGLADAGRVIVDDVERAVLRLEPGIHDVVFVDPPYAMPVESVLHALGRAVSPTGVLVLERDRRSKDGGPPGFAVMRERLYGDTRVVMYSKKEARDHVPDPENEVI